MLEWMIAATGMFFGQVTTDAMKNLQYDREIQEFMTVTLS